MISWKNQNMLKRPKKLMNQEGYGHQKRQGQEQLYGPMKDQMQQRMRRTCCVQVLYARHDCQHRSIEGETDWFPSQKEECRCFHF